MQENLASLGMLTAGIAHEIRNPLNVVVNFASASKELVGEIRGRMPSEGVAGVVGPLLAQLKEYVEKIDEHGRRADRIVRGMLMHSRGKSGVPEQTDLKNLLTDTVNLAWHSRRAQDGGFNVSLEMDFDPETPGIAPELMAKIFLPFFTTKPAGAGTGLGLSLSDDIVVRGHNGTIRAESDPGVETRFIVTLPRGG